MYNHVVPIPNVPAYSRFHGSALFSVTNDLQSVVDLIPPGGTFVCHQRANPRVSGRNFSPVVASRGCCLNLERFGRHRRLAQGRSWYQAGLFIGQLKVSQVRVPPRSTDNGGLTLSKILTSTCSGHLSLSYLRLELWQERRLCRVAGNCV